ncbi:helix-turn-helix domain-containing protein [Ramlibacter sp. G-1-2-2]|uniref:Helix-turn-helix domain-containing protein n=1 Tax=Ramlibacter agri TaxID=2728837 RepID=A0A848GZM2_9BURK|nr:helix-turn-helix domain-containing protein [Ramlibacter agri]NML44015.1 helix-turn-helix domain-containing protein [Ramlibacter agri]
MKPAAPLFLVPFREVRHDQPDDCLHYEAVAVRGEEMNWTIPAHRHEGLHQFKLVVQGSFHGTIEGQAVECTAPALVLVAPGAMHGFTYTHDVVGHQLTVPTATLRGLFGGSLLAQGQLGTSFVVTGAAAQADAQDCLRLFEAVAREFRSDAPGRVHSLLAHATLIAVHFLRQHGAQHAAQQGQGARDTLVQRYRALLEAHYREQQSLSFYADSLGVSSDHLSRTCRRVAGQSAQELLHERVMLEARRLLAYTPAPVAQIAEQLGYADPAYFSKFFARCVGDTPSAYRALVAQGVRSAAPAA